MNSKLTLGLNDSQLAAVTHIDGPLLILAGPGSGKTRVITHRIAYMIEQGIAPESIIALTFTNKAAEEMRRRIERLVGPNPIWAGTFHGFCVRLLRRYARLVGLPENFSIYDMDDSVACLKTAMANSKMELTHVTAGTLAQRISYFKNRLVTPETLESETLSSEEYQVAQVYPEYQRELLRNGAVDFDDILMHTANLLRSYPDLREKLDRHFQYIMVDEYQDTNLAQYVIVRHLSVESRNLAATGDPDQSIYGWRGANIKNVAYLERDYSDLTIVRLENNYRSTPEILSIADALILNNEFRKPKVLVPSRDSGSAVRLSIYPTAGKEADDIADQIVALTTESDYRYSDFGILYRTNAQSRLIERALLRRQIAYQIIGGFRFYLRKEIKDLVSYLLLLNNPDDNIALQRAINTPPRGIGKQTISKLSEWAYKNNQSMLEAARVAIKSGLLKAKTAIAVKEFLKIYDSLCDIVHGPLLDILQATIDMIDYRSHLMKTKGSEDESTDVMTNLDELLAEAKELDEDQSEDRSALERFLEFAALQSDTDSLNSDRDCVTLMTLHAAKGLEFPCVYIVAVEENILPHSRSKNNALELEEERRLLFVGMTRAKDRLQLSYAKSRGFSAQGSGVPSSFLMELPRSEMVVTDHTESLADYYDESGEGEYFADDGGSFSTVRSKADWDEACQLDPCDVDNAGSDEFDDACQLPPEELKNRVMRMVGKNKKIQTASALDSGSSGLAKWAAYKVGRIVEHENLGSGEIISASGHGPKRTVTINFFSDGSKRTFRLSHAPLSLQGQVDE